jgi:hypothetical protein
MRAVNTPWRRFFYVTFLAVFFYVLRNISSDAVTNRRYKTFERPVVNVPCTTPATHAIGPSVSLRLLVSFVFFETVGMSACEITNKRNNLATFLLSAVSTSPSDVQFVFTFPGRKPDVSGILGSAGLSMGSDSGKAISKVLSNKMDNVELLNASVHHPAADLCHHHAAILDKRRQERNFDYVLMLNDGVRGPFFDAGISVDTVCNSPINQYERVQLSICFSPTLELFLTIPREPF